MLSTILILMVIAQTVAPTATTVPVWASILIGLASAGTLTAVINFWPTLKKTESENKKTDSEGEKAEAEASDIIQRAAGELITRIQTASQEAERRYTEQNTILLHQNEELSRQIAELQVEVSKIPELQADITELRHGIEILTQQLKDHGINPIYPPPPPPVYG